MRSFALLIILFFSVCVNVLATKSNDDGYEQRIKDEKSIFSLDCDGLTNNSLVQCVRIREARKIVEEVPLSFFYATGSTGIGKNKKSWKLLKREFALVVFDEVENAWKVIILDMPADDSKLIIRVRTEEKIPYVVERLTGTSFNKMTFKVTQGEKELLPYATKWLRVPDGVPRNDIKKLEAKAESFVFMRTHAHMDDVELAKRGLIFLTNQVERELKALSFKAVASRTKMGLLVTDFIHKEHMVNLILNEQTDPDQLYGKSYVGFFQNRKHPLLYQVNREVLIDFFANGLDAFRYTCSKANACGQFQFTNRSFINAKGEKIYGTYDVVRNAYKQVDLDPVFRRGVESFGNSLWAAVLLFDLELSSPNLPHWVREILDKEKALALVHCVIGYNGGGGRASNFAKFFKKKIDPFHVAVDKTLFPWKELASSLGKNKVMMPETYGYMLKFWHNYHELFTPIPSIEIFEV